MKKIFTLLAAALATFTVSAQTEKVELTVSANGPEVTVHEGVLTSTFGDYTNTKGEAGTWNRSRKNYWDGDKNGNEIKFEPEKSGKMTIFFANTVANNKSINIYVDGDRNNTINAYRGDDNTEIVSGVNIGTEIATNGSVYFYMEAGKTYNFFAGGTKWRFKSYTYEYTSGPAALDNPTVIYDAETGVVTIDGDNVYYTTDGTEPTAESTLYTEPFAVEDGTVVTAKAIGDGENNSDSKAVSVTVNLKVVLAAPTEITTYNGSFYIVADLLPGAYVEYSLDGGESWTKFNRTVTLFENGTVTARVCRENSEPSATITADVEALLPAVKAEKTITIGHGSFDAGKNTNRLYHENDNPLAEDRAYGFNLRLEDQNKNFAEAGKIYMTNIKATRTGIRSSNGCANILEIPEYLEVTRLVIYSKIMLEPSGVVGWKEVNGENIPYELAPMGCFNANNGGQSASDLPDIRVFNFDEPVTGELTFTSAGSQLAYTLAVDVNHIAYAAPTHNYNQGHKFAEGDAIEFSHSHDAAMIIYTLDGNDPDAANIEAAAGEEGEVEAQSIEAADEHVGKTYDLAVRPLTFNGENMTIRYQAVHPNGYFKASPVQEFAVNADGETTGIEAIAVDANEGAVEYFNLQGIRVANPSNGIFIRRQGKNVTKVFVK